MTEPMQEIRRPDRRGVIGAAVLAALLVSAVVVDRSASAPHDSIHQTRVGRRGPGVWGCPVVAPSRLGGTLSLANAGDTPSRIAIRWVRPPLKPVDRSLSLGPQHSIFLPAPASATTFVSAIVEWGGGEIVASAAAPLVTPSKHRVALGAACSQPGEQLLAAAGLKTLRSDSAIVILNPSGADALVSVSFLVDGDEQAPESLRNRIVPARGRLVVHAGDFVFDRPSLAAIVRVVTGSVVAHAEVSGGVGAVMVPFSGLRSDGAATAFLLKDARVDVVAIGDDPATIESSTITSARRQTTQGFPPALDPNTPATVRFGGSGAQAAVLSDREGSGFVADLTWGVPSKTGSDTATLPLGPTARRYVSVIGPPAIGRGMRLVIANPSDEETVVHIRLFTPDGPASFPAGELLPIPAGRANAFTIGLKAAVFGLEITADTPLIASLAGFGGAGPNAFLYSIAPQPSDDAMAPPLLVDPRVGTNAP